SGKSADYWNLGTVSFDGLEITIVDGTTGGGVLRLLEVPPPEWFNQTAVFTPGCGKYYNDCVGWQNNLRFFGIGVSTPTLS
ncbi:hypothetical protein, partial [Acinetobacter baumannii]|uniref:hypothetical protein n=1 Tax=Acinetobacter baumannii TaxID=470 RepID=UPI0024B6E52C